MKRMICSVILLFDSYQVICMEQTESLSDTVNVLLLKIDELQKNQDSEVSTIIQVMDQCDHLILELLKTDKKHPSISVINQGKWNLVKQFKVFNKG